MRIGVSLAVAGLMVCLIAATLSPMGGGLRGLSLSEMRSTMGGQCSQEADLDLKVATSYWYDTEANPPAWKSLAMTVEKKINRPDQDGSLYLTANGLWTNKGQTWTLDTTLLGEYQKSYDGWTIVVGGEYTIPDDAEQYETIHAGVTWEKKYEEGSWSAVVKASLYYRNTTALDGGGSMDAELTFEFCF